MVGIASRKNMPHSDYVGEVPVPIFLGKLWKIVNSSEHEYCTKWDEDGFSFHITNTERFSREVLPYFFKHGNLNSFVRQLNMYGFRKVTSMEHGTAKNSEQTGIQFQHAYFVRDHPELLLFIRRKLSGPRFTLSEDTNDDRSSAPLMNQVLTEIQQVKEEKSQMDERLSRISKENSQLWQEIAAMRQLHLKQHQLINQIIQFLLRLVQSEKGVGKRPLLGIAPRMITSSSKDSDHKRSRLSNDVSELMHSLEQQLNQQHPSRGPIIADVTDEIDSIRDGASPSGLQPNVQKTASCDGDDSLVVDQVPSVVEATPSCSSAETDGKQTECTAPNSPFALKCAGEREAAKICLGEFLNTYEPYPGLSLHNMQTFLDEIGDCDEVTTSDAVLCDDGDSPTKLLRSAPYLTAPVGDDFDNLHELFAPNGNTGDYDVFGDDFLADKDFGFSGGNLSPVTGKELSVYQPSKFPVCSASNEQDSVTLLSAGFERETDPKKPDVSFSPQSRCSAVCQK